MRRVGVITIYRNLNYGSVLQTFATVQTIERMKFQCEVIDYKYPNTYHSIKAQDYRQRKKRESIIIKIIRRIGKVIIKENIEIKKKRFKSFLMKNLTFSKEFESIESIRNDPPDYDIYLTGSDQVWNPKYCHDDTTFLLDFVQNSAKRIAYGSSFGANSLSEEYKLLYGNLLDKYDSISVREKSGESIVKNLINKEAVHVLDPTLLLSDDDWNKVAEPKRLYNEPYILCYLMRYSFDPYPYAYQLIKYLKRKLGLQAVFIEGDPYFALRKGNTMFPDVSPGEFISLFRDAEFVVTASFHGTAFSLNYSKPFYTIIDNKPTLDDRQLSLVNKLGAKDRILVKGQAFRDIVNLGMDYSKIEKNLDKERSKSISWLKAALHE